MPYSKYHCVVLFTSTQKAVACVSGDSRHANEVISKALDYIEDNVDGYVTDIQVEIL